MVTKEELKSILTEEDYKYACDLYASESGNIVDLSEQLFGRDGIMTVDEVKEYVSGRKEMDEYRKNPYTKPCGFGVESA